MQSYIDCELEASTPEVNKFENQQNLRIHTTRYRNLLQSHSEMVICYIQHLTSL